MSSGYSFVALDSLLPAISSVNGMNNVGQLVGTYTDASSVVHGFTWKNGVLTTVDAVVNPNYLNIATAINDLGEVAGYGMVGVNGIPLPFTVDATGVATFQSFGYTYPADIDNSGRLLTNGHDYIYFLNEAMFGGTQIFDPKSDQTGGTTVFGVNGSGTDVVGSYVVSGSTHAFLFDGTSYTDIPISAQVSLAYDVNDLGQVVGAYTDQTGTHGFFYDGTTVTTIDNPLAVYGTRLTEIRC